MVTFVSSCLCEAGFSALVCTGPIPLRDCAQFLSKLWEKTSKPDEFQTVHIAGYAATTPAAPDAGELVGG